MPNWLRKIPVPGDLVKFEQPDFLGREESVIDNASGSPMVPGTVLQGDNSSAEPWDGSVGTPDPIYGILLMQVPDGEEAKVAVLIAGPAAINPFYLVWDSANSAPEIEAGLAELKEKKFIFTREPLATAIPPEPINRVED